MTTIKLTVNSNSIKTAKNTSTNTDKASHKYIKWEQTLLTTSTDYVILFGNEMPAKKKKDLGSSKDITFNNNNMKHILVANGTSAVPCCLLSFHFFPTYCEGML